MALLPEVYTRPPDVAARATALEDASHGRSSFAARRACHRAGRFGPDPLARAAGWRIMGGVCKRRRAAPRRALAPGFGRYGYKTVAVSDNLHFTFRTLPSVADRLGKWPPGE
jgi:hypothetical protein